MRHSYLLLPAVSAAALLVSACARNVVAQQQAAPVPQVTVATAIVRKVTEFDEFTGRFEAVERVEVRPRVSGYISSVNFTDGNEVKKGDVLFVIDPLDGLEASGELVKLRHLAQNRRRHRHLRHGRRLLLGRDVTCAGTHEQRGGRDGGEQ